VFTVLTVRRSQFLAWIPACLGYPLKGLNQCRASCPRHRVKKAAAAGILPTVLSLSMIFFLLLASSPASAQMSVLLEYRTKAYFLAQFPKFIDWPDTAFPSAQAPFLICILGESSFGHSIAEFTRGTVAQGTARRSPLGAPGTGPARLPNSLHQRIEEEAVRKGF
jgi:hypothetical protein